jgi:hypothetical protein
MAIRIVKTEPDPSVLIKLVCRFCGVTLEFLPIDVKENYVTDMGGGGDTMRTVDCPNCKKILSVK